MLASCNRYYTSDSLWKIWLAESIQSIHNSLWTWHDKCNICCRYCIYHVKFTSYCSQAIVCRHSLWKHIFVPDEGLAYSLYNGPIDSESLEALPGPTPRTVLEPGAICVLPASVIRHVSKPKDLAFLVRSTLWGSKFSMMNHFVLKTWLSP